MIYNLGGVRHVIALRFHLRLKCTLVPFHRREIAQLQMEFPILRHCIAQC